MREVSVFSSIALLFVLLGVAHSDQLCYFPLGGSLCGVVRRTGDEDPTGRI